MDYPDELIICGDCSNFDQETKSCSVFWKCQQHDSNQFFKLKKPRPYRFCDSKGRWRLDIDALMSCGLSYRLAETLAFFNLALHWAHSRHWAHCVLIIADILVDEAQASKEAPRDDA